MIGRINRLHRVERFGAVRCPVEAPKLYWSWVIKGPGPTAWGTSTGQMLLHRVEMEGPERSRINCTGV